MRRDARFLGTENGQRWERGDLQGHFLGTASPLIFPLLLPKCVRVHGSPPFAAGNVTCTSQNDLWRFQSSCTGSQAESPAPGVSRTLAYAMGHMDGTQPIHFATLREVGTGRKGTEKLSGRLGPETARQPPVVVLRFGTRGPRC